MLELIGGGLFIFLARVTDVSMATFRTLMIVRGKRIQAASIGFFEVMIYVIALNKVVNSLDKPINLIIYALGFASGNYLGSFLEEKMALGNISAQIIPNNNTVELIDYLRGEGFGVTVFEGYGKEGLKKVLYISLKRRELHRLLDKVGEVDEDSFVTIMDARETRGGYYRKQRKAK